MQTPVDPRLHSFAHVPRSNPEPQPTPSTDQNETLPTQPIADAQQENTIAHIQPLFVWHAPEYEKTVRERNWYFAVFGLLVLMIGYALFTDSLLMAIVFIMIAVLMYLFEIKEPRIIPFGITYDGVFAQDRLYEFATLEHFWIFYEPGGKRMLSLKSDRGYLPYVQMPIGDTDPSALREVLIQFIPEQRHEEGPFDWLERFF